MWRVWVGHEPLHINGGSGGAPGRPFGTLSVQTFWPLTWELVMSPKLPRFPRHLVMLNQACTSEQKAQASPVCALSASTFSVTWCVICYGSLVRQLR